jgi:hypothetical protein
MQNTIFTSFPDSSTAEKAVGALLDHGVRPEDISVLRGDSTVQTEYVTYEKGGITEEPSDADVPPGIGSSNTAVTTRTVGIVDTDQVPHSHDTETSLDVEKAGKGGISTTTPADAKAGAIKGTSWGTGLGVIAAIASLASPGVGIVIGGGALAVALGGVAATAGAGAISGAVTGYLKDQGMDEHVAASYEEALANGGYLVSVSYPSGKVDELTIRQTLEKYGPLAVNTSTAGYVA